jgi:IclR family acetate operon transcriptional repressor
VTGLFSPGILTPAGASPGSPGRSLLEGEIISSVVKNKPPYAIESVDHALHLAQLLQQEGELRVRDAAERLGVSASTAHRLLAMLVYRDFAEQGPDRRYRPGLVLRPTEPSQAPVVRLRRLALPHLRALVEGVRETANLMVRVGSEIRFIATVECDQALRVGDRVGRVLPAHATSGGKVLLAEIPPAELTRLYASRGEVDLTSLRRELSLVRKRAFAINDQKTETGLTAVGVAVRGPDVDAVAAVSLAMPTARFDRDRLPTWVSALSTTATAIGGELAAI